MIIVATPIALVIAAGWQMLASDELRDSLRNAYVVAGSTIVFGALLWWADVKGGTTRKEGDMTIKDALLIGASQTVAALIPGTSRSGITMTVARSLGFARDEAARFSMLIGAPLLAAVGAYAFIELAGAETTGNATLMDGLFVAVLSFVSGLISIAALMALLKKMSFLPFVIYRFALGGALLLMAPHLVA
jgi:undecaprenyl-diphosphatase